MRYDFFKNEFLDINSLTDNAFIVGTDETLSSKEAYQRIQKLKSLLENTDFDKNRPVVIYGEKQANFPIAIMTLYHSYIPFVGIDAIFPENRVKSIMETTKASVVINLSEVELNLDADVVIDKHFNITKYNTGLTNKLVTKTEDSLSYIMFTSGSTGTPKGVQITRSSFLNFVKWYITWDILHKDNVYMNQATFSFDVFFCDLIGAFHFGSLLVLNDLKILKDSSKFLERFSKYQATTLYCTPSFVSMYLTLPQFNEENYPHFKHIALIGEVVFSALVKKIQRAFPNLEIINSYGPTETTVVATYINLNDTNIEEFNKTLPVGYCKFETEILIDNESKNPEEEGELILVGDNVSIGYCNREDLNKEKFFVHNGKRAYRSGDIAFMKNDLIYFIGRKDNQIKLNGYRIELDEITAILLKHPEVLAATTLPLKSGNVVKKIISFITLKNKSEVDMNEALKQYLNIDLPIYMVPSEIITIKEMPINPNYKIDSKALTGFYLNK